MTPSPSAVDTATDAAMSSGDLLQIAVVVLTGLFALLGGWLGSKLGKATEYQQWLRNQKHVAYVTFLNEARNFLNMAGTLSPEHFGLQERQEWAARIRPTTITLLAPDPIRESASTLHGWLLWLSLNVGEERVKLPHVRQRIEVANDEHQRLEVLCREELRDLKVQ